MRRGRVADRWVPAAQAVTIDSQGPLNRARIEIAAAPAFAIIIGTRNGDTRRGALLVEDVHLLLQRLEATDAGREDDPGASRVDGELAGVFERHLGSRDGELAEAVGSARLFRTEADGSGRSP